MKKFALLSLVLGLSTFANEENSVPLLGHNLTPTSYTLADKQFSAGTYALGYGITENWTIATSPWLVIAYNMPMLETKFAFETETFFKRISLDANYFRTFPYLRNLYDQESTFLRLTGTHKFTEFYTLHVSLGHQYFFRDERPFSLRLLPDNLSKTNLSLSTLSEFHVTSRFGGFFEFGLMGLSYSVPWLHTGLSGFYSWNWGLVQFGFSRTVSLGANAVIWHPETQLQFFF